MIVFAQAEYIYNSLFTCVGAGAPTAACDNACHVCAGNTTYGTYAQQYTALLLAAQQSNAQHPSCPQTCLRATRAITIGCTTTCGGTGLQTNCTFDSIRSSGAGINITDAVNITKTLNVAQTATFALPPIVPRLPYATAYVQSGFGVPSYTDTALPLFTTAGDATLQAAIGSYNGPGGSANLGTFTAPYNGTFVIQFYCEKDAAQQILMANIKLKRTGDSAANNVVRHLMYGGAAHAAYTIQLNQNDAVQSVVYSTHDQNQGKWIINAAIYSVQLLARHS